ncbi:hypothetical protein JCM6882_005182 [Rhodosporidiobolus microsporus]
MSSSEVAPAAVFLVLYTAFFLLLSTLYATKRIKWKSRYTFVFVHVTLRVVGMALGVAFSEMEWEEGGGERVDAYLVFSAEGYFSLILCAYRFLVVWQQDRFGSSPLEPRIPKGTPKRQQWRMHLRAPLASLHWALITANALIISGSSIMAGAIGKEDDEGTRNKQDTAKRLRVAGTVIFLFVVQVFFVLCLFSARRYNKRGDRTLFLIAATWPFLTVRGVYGILNVLVSAYSYSSSSVYTRDGFTSTFLVGEHVLGTAMEWLACGLLLATYFSRVVGGEGMVEDWAAADRREDEREGETPREGKGVRAEERV